jgi:hypothetical protein
METNEVKTMILNRKMVDAKISYNAYLQELIDVSHNGDFESLDEAKRMFIDAAIRAIDNYIELNNLKAK